MMRGLALRISSASIFSRFADVAMRRMTWLNSKPIDFSETQDKIRGDEEIPSVRFAA
jgi:hypothetical protein